MTQVATLTSPPAATPAAAQEFTCQRGRRCVLRHPPTSAPDFDSIYLFSLHKAGSTLLNKVMIDLGQAAGIGVMDIPGQLFVQGIHSSDYPALEGNFFRPKGYIYSGFRTFPQMFDFPESMSANAGLLIRDPRDILTSMYFSFTGTHQIAQSDPSIRKQIEESRRRENERGICRYVLRNAHLAQADYDSYGRWIDQMKLWRYEDIIFAKTEWVREIARHFRIPVTDTQIDEIAERHDIRPEVERPDSHIRKVAPGDSLEKLSPRIRGYLDRRFRTMLEKHGYVMSSAAAKLPAAAQQRAVRKPLVRPKVVFPGALRLETPVDPLTMEQHRYSTRTNCQRLIARFSNQFYGYLIDADRSALKCYQDLLVLAFIEDNVLPGSRILDVGGGHSRLLRHLAPHYECWLIDEFNGMGNGPKDVKPEGYRVVKGLMGQFLRESLPDDSFDLVFSVSALEHCPRDAETVRAVIEDLDRVTKPGGMNVHCLDAVITRQRPGELSIVHQLFFDRATYPVPKPASIIADPDLYKLPENIYRNWKMPQPYDQVAIVDTCAFWPKGDLA
jgi:ubiquinone/menaquinone biosynthesis C-methylase UbiE